jgi:2-isopropylmalate synthase
VLLTLPATATTITTLTTTTTTLQDLADKKKELSSLDLESIVNDELRDLVQAAQTFELLGVQVLAGNRNTPTATVAILDKTKDSECQVPAIGTGPVDATFKAINAAVAGHGSAGGMKLLEYSVGSVTAGIDALGEVRI